MLASGVLAMDDPVSIKTQPGDWVKVYVWPVENGPLLNMGDGIADENGTFSHTFFSLNVPNVKFTVFVIRNSEKIRDVDFLGHNISEPLNIDCTGTSCEIVEEIIIEESIEIEKIENNTLNESVIVDDAEFVRSFKEFIFTGKAIFSKEDGSVNWSYSIGSFAILLCLIVFVFVFLHRGKAKVADVMCEDEKELQYMEKKVKDTADKIKNIKEGKERKVKIESVKKKLAEEESELKRLEGGENDDKIEKQEDVVERVKDSIEKAENQGD